MADSDFERRISRARDYIKEHFGTQQAFAKEAGLTKSLVSRALNEEKTSDSALSRVEAAIFRRQQRGEIPSVESEVLDELEEMANRLQALARELRDR